MKDSPSTRRWFLRTGSMLTGIAVSGCLRMVGGGQNTPTPTKTVPGSIPNAKFAFTYDEDGGRNSGSLTIRHSGGDPIPADQLKIRSSDGDSTTWNMLGSTSVSSDDNIRRGDTAKINATVINWPSDIRPSEIIHLIFVSKDGSPTTLTTFNIRQEAKRQTEAIQSGTSTATPAKTPTPKASTNTETPEKSTNEFKYGFEKGNFDGWTVLAPHKNCQRTKNKWYVTKEKPISGDFSLRVDADGPWNGVGTKKKVIDMERDFDLKYSWRTSDPNNRGPHMGAYATLDGLKKCEQGVQNHRKVPKAFGVWFDPDAISKEGSPYRGGIGFWATDGLISRPSLAANTVHTVTIRKRGKRGTLLIDGNEIGKGPFSTTSGQYHLIIRTSGTWGSPTNLTLDDITITYI